MTYFGVNYYLAGLHSYAKAEPAPVPRWVICSIISLVIIVLLAWYRNSKFKHKYQ